jgi:hypothetical protein
MDLIATITLRRLTKKSQCKGMNGCFAGGLLVTDRHNRVLEKTGRWTSPRKRPGRASGGAVDPRTDGIFEECSHGVRSGGSAHDVLEAVREQFGQDARACMTQTWKAISTVFRMRS